MALRGVLFDLGRTILHYAPAGKTWEDMERIGALGVYRQLLDQQYALLPETNALDIAWDCAHTMWSTLDSQDVKNLRLSYQIGLVVRQWGIENLPADMTDALALVYMSAIQAYVTPLEGAEETLRGLRDLGLRIGLISNTIWPGNSHKADLDRYNLTPYFDHLIFSADAELWKPHKEVFQLGLNALGLKPEEAIFVGDALYFDVWGAQQVGMRGVWIEQSHVWLPDGLEVTPDAVIKSLPDLLDIVEGWR